MVGPYECRLAMVDPIQETLEDDRIVRRKFDNTIKRFFPISFEHGSKEWGVVYKVGHVNKVFRFCRPYDYWNNGLEASWCSILACGVLLPVRWRPLTLYVLQFAVP